MKALQTAIALTCISFLVLLACVDEPGILTPPPPAAPQINGPAVYGARPGNPFLYRIPCTGARPITFSAERLPASLTLDAETGIISGATPAQQDDHEVVLKARNANGEFERTLRIVVGDQLALTPPMGWNDWYTFYDRVTDRLMRQAADVFISSGMADFGYQYVNIDDCWMVKHGASDPELGGPPRNANGCINANRRFPDMRALTDYIHAKGLKAGIYTSPGPLTCAGYAGSYQHEALDAQRFSEWGFDFLKYDWCSYEQVAVGEGLERLQWPYRLMGDLLTQQPRDIVFNLCQAGMGEVWRWGGDVGGHSWRTTGDLGLEKATHLPGFYSIAFSNAAHHEYAGPGRWNDPDYILIGYVGDAYDFNAPARPTPLTPSKQYSYMSLWCLMAALLFFSGDITRLDDFTLGILCNAEVIEIDQDPLGRQGVPLRRQASDYVMAKALVDGSIALGLFNLEEKARRIAVSWSELGLSGRQRVRDLWRQKELGVFEGSFAVKVTRHGVSLVRLSPAR